MKGGARLLAVAASLCFFALPFLPPIADAFGRPALPAGPLTGGVLFGCVGAAAALGLFAGRRRERHRAGAVETALRRSEDRFRALIENAADAITILGADGAIRYESPAVLRMLGYHPEEMIGRNAFGFVHPDDRAHVQEKFGELMAEPGGSLTVEFRFRHKDGGWVWLGVRGINMLDHPTVAGILTGSRDVTAERTAAEKLQQSEAFFRAVTEHSTDLVTLVDARGALRYVSPSVEALLGYPADELLGHDRIDLVHPADADRLRALFREQIGRPGSVAHAEYRMRHRDGHYMVLASTSRNALHEPSIRAFVINSRDVTERTIVETALHASNDRYRLVTRATNDTIYDWNVAARRIVWGGAITQVLGYPPNGAGTEPGWWEERIHPDDAGRVRGSLDAVLGSRAEVWAQEYRFRRQDGSWAVILDRGFIQRSAAGEPTRMIGAMADITERKRIEADLVRSKETAEEASRAKSDFLASMSHELRTPLNSVIGFAGVLRKNRAGHLVEQDLTYLDRILSNGKHLLGLINDVLDLSKIEAGKAELDRAPVAVDVLVFDTLAELGASAREGVTLSAQVDQPIALIEGDALKLRQILTNFVANALKFTEQGSVTVVARADPATGRPLFVEVRDTGIGIAPDRLAAIFHAFEQEEMGTARRFGGTGLGLSISAALARLMGMQIEVESRVGEGSTFRLRIPPPASPSGDASAPAAAEPARLRGAPARLGAPAPAADPDGPHVGRRVLVIDDHPDACLVLTHCLAEHGCTVLVARSGEQGIMLAREHRPDLITLDLLMPGMGGCDVLRVLRNDPALAAIPVVIVSVMADQAKLADFGIVDMLDKPVSREGAVAVLNRYLRPDPASALLAGNAA